MIKPWKFMTEKEIYNLKEKQCKKCRYFSKNNAQSTTYGTCEYIAIEGHSRGCLPTECTTKGIFKESTGVKKRRAAISL